MGGNGNTDKKNYIYMKKYRVIFSLILILLLFFTVILPFIIKVFSEKNITIRDWVNLVGLTFFETAFLLLIMSVLYNKMFKKRVIPLMYEKCDPESFTEANMQFLNNKESTKATVAITNSNIALGEFYMGNFGKAISIMNSIIYSDAFNKSNKLVKVHYLINLVVYMMESYPNGSMDSIDRIMNEIHGLCADIDPKRMSALKLDKRIESIDRAYAYIKGNADGYEAYLIKSFNEDANNIFGRATAAFSLMSYYKSIGNTQEMIKYADFVIANGNKLYFVPIASEWKIQTEAKAEQ